MYISSIIGYLSWPFLITVSYFCVRWALRYYERKFPEALAEEQEA